VVPGQEGNLGDQIRGFGFSRAGDVDSLLRFSGGLAFTQAYPFAANPNGFLPGAAGIPARKQVVEVLLAFPTNLKPIVGQQVTVSEGNRAATAARVSLLLARADAGDADLVAKTQDDDGRPRGYVCIGAGGFRPDSTRRRIVTRDELVRGTQDCDVTVTFTAVPPGRAPASASTATATAASTATSTDPHTPISVPA
jgi:hypothetical protein